MKNLSKFEMNAVMGGAHPKRRQSSTRYACTAPVADEEIIDRDVPL